jgi:hypothetical protein
MALVLRTSRWGIQRLTRPGRKNWHDQRRPSSSWGDPPSSSPSSASCVAGLLAAAAAAPGSAGCAPPTAAAQQKPSQSGSARQCATASRSSRHRISTQWPSLAERTASHIRQWQRAARPGTREACHHIPTRAQTDTHRRRLRAADARSRCRAETAAQRTPLQPQRARPPWKLQLDPRPST